MDMSKTEGTYLLCIKNILTESKLEGRKRAKGEDVSFLW